MAVLLLNAISNNALLHTPYIFCFQGNPQTLVSLKVFNIIASRKNPMYKLLIVSAFLFYLSDVINKRKGILNLTE